MVLLEEVIQVQKIIKNIIFSMVFGLISTDIGARENAMRMSEKSVSDLNTSVFEALKTNPEILIQKAEQDASNHKLTQVIGTYLPSLDLKAGVGKEYVKQAYRKTALASIDTRGSINRTRYDPSVTLNQKIFDGLETPYEIRKSHKEIYQSAKNLEEAQILIAFNAMDRYIAVRRFERLVQLAKDNVTTHESILAKIKKLVAGGKATTGDASNVQSRLYDAKAAVGDIQGDLDTAYANFKEVIGAEAEKLVTPTFDDSLLPKTVQEAVEMAQKMNRSVIVARATEAVAKVDFDKTISPFLPSIDFQMQAKKDYDVGGKAGVSTNITGQFIGTFNVFKGGRDIGKRRELRAKMRSAKYKKHKEMRRAEKEVRVSYAELISARAQSKALRGAVQSKKAVRNIYMKQFDAGTRSFIDILDASHEFFLAKGSLITSDATEDLSAARLLASVGTLLDQFKDSLEETSSRDENSDANLPQLELVSKQDTADIEKDIKAPVENAPKETVATAPEMSVEMVDNEDTPQVETDVMEERDLAQAEPNMSDVY